MVDDAQTHVLPANPQALDNVAHLHGLADGAELIDRSLTRMSSVRDRSSTALHRTSASNLSNDPDLLAQRTRRDRVRRSCRSGEARLATGAQAKHGRSARLPHNRPSRRCFPALLSAIASGRRPGACAQPAKRHRRAAVERREPVPPARCAASARGAARASSSRMRPRLRINWAAGLNCSKACSTRRVSRCRREAADFARASDRHHAGSSLRRRRSTVYAAW